MKNYFIWLLAVGLVLTSCNVIGIQFPVATPALTNTPAPTLPPLPTPTEFPTPVPTVAPPTFTPAPTFALPTAARGGTAAPTSSSTVVTTTTPVTTTVTRYDTSWGNIKPTTFDITNEVKSNLLTLTPRTFAQWLNASQGGFVYKPVTGNFRITALIKTRKRTAEAALTNKSHMAGLMARNSPIPENYVHIAVGNGATAFAVEATNTISGASKAETANWPNGDAELRICRVGQVFTLYRRLPNATTWTLAATYTRADLANELQVGATVSTAAAPDLKAMFDNLRIEIVKDKADCEK